MPEANLQSVAEQVVLRARRQGYVVPSEVREELTRAGLAETLWREVVSQTQPALVCRSGRYYYPVASDSVQRARSQQEEIRRAVRRLIRLHRAAAARVERRGQDRFDFIQPVKVRTEDDREFTLLSRDLSSTGIRLVGTRRLLGQKVRISIPQPEDGPPSHFVVRILWTCAVGDDLFENGGSFLEVEDADG
jgi:hypothetical protein